MSRGVGIHYCWICSIDDSLFLLGRVGGKTMVHYLGWYMMTPVLPIPLNSSVHEYHEFLPFFGAKLSKLFPGSKNGIRSRATLIHCQSPSRVVRRILLLC